MKEETIKATTWINPAYDIFEEPKKWVALPLIEMSDTYLCVMGVDGDKIFVPLKRAEWKNQLPMAEKAPEPL